MDRYVVIGNPVAHSLSPEIHAHFARALGEAIDYRAMPVALGTFAPSVQRFFDEGGSGANVTLPFKAEAFRLAGSHSERARLAGAANVLMAVEGGLRADNTDGAGLVRDLVENLGIALRGRRVLLLGAGGAARGVAGPLLRCAPAALVVANRTADKALQLARDFAALGPVSAVPLESIGAPGFDVILNATSSSLLGAPIAIAPAWLRPGAFAYDMAYGDAARPFLAQARALGARASDGLGMLVEQAAESYLLWRGRRPSTGAVLAQLRARLA